MALEILEVVESSLEGKFVRSTLNDIVLMVSLETVGNECVQGPSDRER